MNKGLYGYTFLRKGNEEGEYKILQRMLILGIVITIGSIITFIIFLFNILSILTGLGGMLMIYFSLTNREKREYVDYINSKGEIKRIFEEDWTMENTDKKKLKGIPIGNWEINTKTGEVRNRWTKEILK